MAILKNAFVSIGGTDHSTDSVDLNLTLSIEPQDDTAMGDDTRSSAPGLKLVAFSGTCNAAFGAGSIEASLTAAYGVSVAWIIRPDAGVVAATNPQWAGNGYVSEYPPVSGAAGDLQRIAFTVMPTGDWTRTTS